LPESLDSHQFVQVCAWRVIRWLYLYVVRVAGLADLIPVGKAKDALDAPDVGPIVAVYMPGLCL